MNAVHGNEYRQRMKHILVRFGQTLANALPGWGPGPGFEFWGPEFRNLWLKISGSRGLGFRVVRLAVIGSDLGGSAFGAQRPVRLMRINRSLYYLMPMVYHKTEVEIPCLLFVACFSQMHAI